LFGCSGKHHCTARPVGNAHNTHQVLQSCRHSCVLDIVQPLTPALHCMLLSPSCRSYSTSQAAGVPGLAAASCLS
jgi:hypothetical protein